MSDRIIIQGSGGTIGDTFLSSHVAYNLHLNTGRDVYVAIPKGVSKDIKKLYKRHTFFAGVIEIDNIEKESFLKYCSDNFFEPSLFLESLEHYRNISFKPLKKWFMEVDTPTVTQDKSVIVHVSSSTNFDRPMIPYLAYYLQAIIDSGYIPIFMGTHKDEELFLKNYPGHKEIFNLNDSTWRFGKDSLLQSLSNIEVARGCFSFSSWSSIYSSLNIKPTLEMWTYEQWVYYSNMVKYMLGSPINLFQISSNDNVSFDNLGGLFERSKELTDVLYNNL